MSVMTGGSGGLIFVSFKEDTKNFDKVKEKIEKELKEIGHKGTWGSMAMSASSMGSNELSYTLTGENLDRIIGIRGSI